MYVRPYTHQWFGQPALVEDIMARLRLLKQQLLMVADLHTSHNTDNAEDVPKGPCVQRQTVSSLFWSMVHFLIYNAGAD